MNVTTHDQIQAKPQVNTECFYFKHQLIFYQYLQCICETIWVLTNSNLPLNVIFYIVWLKGSPLGLHLRKKIMLCFYTLIDILNGTAFQCQPCSLLLFGITRPLTSRVTISNTMLITNILLVWNHKILHSRLYLVYMYSKMHGYTRNKFVGGCQIYIMYIFCDKITMCYMC